MPSVVNLATFERRAIALGIPPITLPRAKTDLLRAIAHAPVKPKAVNDRRAERRGMDSLRADGTDN